MAIVFRRLLPADDRPGPLDAMALVANESRDQRQRADADRRGPWVMTNMVTSIDGAVAVDGTSSALGGDGDREMFAALRSAADVVLVGAGTVRAENYGPARAHAGAAEARAAAGQAPTPTMAVVTGSAGLEPDHRIFSPEGPRPVVITTARAPEARVGPLRSVADVVVAGDERVDMALALAALQDRHQRPMVVLAEGGPSVLGQLIADDLIDEFNLTTAPVLLAGAAGRIAHGPTAASLDDLELARLVEHDSTLFARYLRR